MFHGERCDAGSDQLLVCYHEVGKSRNRRTYEIMIGCLDFSGFGTIRGKRGLRYWMLGLRKLMCEYGGRGQCKKREDNECDPFSRENHWNIILGLWPLSK